MCVLSPVTILAINLPVDGARLKARILWPVARKAFVSHGQCWIQGAGPHHNRHVGVDKSVYHAAVVVLGILGVAGRHKGHVAVAELDYCEKLGVSAGIRVLFSA